MTTMSNAGPPPERSPLTTEVQVPRWVYRIDREPRKGSGYTQMSFGTHPKALLRMASDNTPFTAGDVAVYVAARARIEHGYYKGKLTVWVWTGRDFDHYRDPVPEDIAERFEYPAGEPAHPHEVLDDAADPADAYAFTLRETHGTEEST